MGTSLTGLTPATTYDALIKTGDNAPIDATLKTLSDGLGNNLPMEVSTTSINFTGTLLQSGTAVPTQAQVNAKQDTLVSGTNIKTINGTSVLGSGNITTPTTSPGGSTGQVQFNNAGAFGASSSLFWDNTNSRLGIGTSSPTAQLTIGNTDFVVGANAGYSTYYGSAINGTIQATSSGSTTQLWFRSNGNAVNQNDNYWSRIEQADGGPMRILSSRYQSLILGNNGYNNAITLYNTSAFTMPKIGINNATPTALLQITGTGSTSATTSLLVQNSGGTDMLRMRDDGVLLLGTTASGLGTIYVPYESSFGERVFMAIQEIGRAHV